MQMRCLLTHMHKVWKRQLIDYTVYIVTQSTQHFNRGNLMSVGFAEENKGININDSLSADQFTFLPYIKHDFLFLQTILNKAKTLAIIRSN